MLLSNSIRVLLRSRSRLKPSFLQAAHTIKFSTQPENNNVEVPSILEERPLDRLLENNRSWRKSMLKKDPSYFKNMAEGQQPEYLIIGCSDSRLGAEKIMGLDMGEVFVHRNIANVFIPTDMNLLSVLFYATTVLKVKDIIILGHYGCGGVLAASQDGDLGYFEHWLRNIRNVQDRYKDELDAISDSDDRHRRLVELNVQEQCFSLYANNLVRSENAKNNRPRVHGMVYDIGEGLLKNLDIDFQSEANQYRDTLTAADYEKCVPLNINHVIGKKVAGSEIDRLVTIESGGGKVCQN